MARTGLQVVTFDAGGTLLHSDPSPAEIYAAELSRLGPTVTADDVGPVFAAAWAEMQSRTPAGKDRYASLPGGERAWWGRFIREVLGRLDHQAPWDVLLERLYAAFSSPSIWKTYPGARTTLAELAARGFKLAVISNWDGRLPKILTHLGLVESFQVVTVSAIAGVEKPASEIFETTLSALAAPATAALHVGDSPVEDYRGARDAGLDAVLIDRSGLFADAPFQRIDHLTQLLDLLL
jgi:putative hydrolase of the HAD superfamily